MVCTYSFEISRSDSYIKVIESRSRSQEQKSVFVCSVCGWFDLERKQSCVIHFFKILLSTNTVMNKQIVIVKLVNLILFLFSFVCYRMYFVS